MVVKRPSVALRAHVISLRAGQQRQCAVSLSTVGGGDTNELVQPRVGVRDRVLGLRAPPTVTAGRPHLIGSSFSGYPVV